MLRRLLFLLTLAVGVSLAAAAVGDAGTSKSAGLVGEVGPGFSIEVKLNGKDLKTIKAGTYKIKVRGQGLDPRLPPDRQGPEQGDVRQLRRATRRGRVTFKPGKVTYQCDPHASHGHEGIVQGHALTAG